MSQIQKGQITKPKKKKKRKRVICVFLYPNITRTYRVFSKIVPVCPNTKFYTIREETLNRFTTLFGQNKILQILNLWNTNVLTRRLSRSVRLNSVCQKILTSYLNYVKSLICSVVRDRDSILNKNYVSVIKLLYMTLGLCKHNEWKPPSLIWLFNNVAIII